MCSDLFTKNLPRQVYEKHAKIYVGDDEYMLKEEQEKNEVGNIQVEEGVRREMTPRWYSDVHKIHSDQDLIKNSKEVYGRSIVFES
jgi:ethanolamine ammonia-lyase large subunit